MTSTLSKETSCSVNFLFLVADAGETVGGVFSDFSFFFFKGLLFDLWATTYIFIYIHYILYFFLNRIIFSVNSQLIANYI